MWTLNTSIKYFYDLSDSFANPDFQSKNRVICFILIARTWFRNDLKLAEKRKPLIKEYLNNVLKIKSISQCQQAQAFFKARPGDPQDDDPILKRETVHSSAENQVEAKGINSTIRISEDSSIGEKVGVGACTQWTFHQISELDKLKFNSCHHWNFAKIYSRWYYWEGEWNCSRLDLFQILQ